MRLQLLLLATQALPFQYNTCPCAVPSGILSATVEIVIVLASVLLTVMFVPPANLTESTGVPTCVNVRSAPPVAVSA